MSQVDFSEVFKAVSKEQDDLGITAQAVEAKETKLKDCLLYTSPSPRDS